MIIGRPEDPDDRERRLERVWTAKDRLIGKWNLTQQDEPVTQRDVVRRKL